MRLPFPVRFVLTALFGAVLLVSGRASAFDPENALLLELKDGPVVIEMRPDLAPRHVEQIKRLTREKFYDGVVFHRVIEGFMAQTGDPTGTGAGGSGRRLPAEFSRERHVPGVVSMARAQDPNSADSQFFIMFSAYPSLDGQYTIWGRVTAGMEAVNRIKRGDSARNGVVQTPDRIVRMRVMADVPAAERPVAAR
jgi:peptidylprolyl isomerase